MCGYEVKKLFFEGGGRGERRGERRRGEGKES